MSEYCRHKAEGAALRKWADVPDFTDWRTRKVRPMPMQKAEMPPTARERDLIDALKRTEAALRLLQPALNVMARECLDDIIAREIEPALTAAPTSEGEGK